MDAFRWFSGRDYEGIEIDEHGNVMNAQCTEADKQKYGDTGWTDDEHGVPGDNVVSDDDGDAGWENDATNAHNY
jgi:hypothetical protein